MPGVPRRLNPGGGERLATVVSHLTPGAVTGTSRVIQPVGSRASGGGGGGGAAGTASGLFHAMSFTATSGAQTLTLDFLPRAYSEHVYLNGIQLVEGTEWTRELLTRDVAILAPADAQAGDWLEVRYAFDSTHPTELA